MLLFIILHQFAPYWILFTNSVSTQTTGRKELCQTTACGTGAICVVRNNTSKCVCRPGFRGNPLEKCTVRRKSTKANPCDPSPCGINTECKVINRVSVCSCQSGFEGDPFSQCTPTPLRRTNTKANPCDPSPCGINTECRVVNLVSVCSCQSGFEGDPFSQCTPTPQPTSQQLCNPKSSNCRAAEVFVEEFKNLNPNKWRPVVQFPSYPDHEFVMYDNNNTNLYVKNGVLHIKPTLFADAYGEAALYNSSFDLSTFPPAPQKCTSSPESGECKKTAHGFQILPPIISSRIITAQPFRYGTYQIRAKMPAGDWIYPQIELISNKRKYGRSSGTIIIALTRGNHDLKLPGANERVDFGTKWLEGGLFPSTYFPKKNKEMFAKFNPDGWDKDFHNYTLDWYSDQLTWSVDGEIIGKLSVKTPFLPWAKRKMAPFDEEMKIALGVGVGGIQRFPDGILTFESAKPWKNNSPKNMFDFWKGKDKWFKTWKGDDVALKIDSVKVINYYQVRN